MNSNPKPGQLANDLAETILSAIFGPDLIGCHMTPEGIAPLIEQALQAYAQKEQTINALFVQVLEKIQQIATPPDRSQIHDAAHLATVLGERADAILQISSQTLKAWQKLTASEESRGDT